MNQPTPNEKTAASQKTDAAKASISDDSRLEIDALRTLLGPGQGANHPGTSPNDIDTAND